MRIREFADRVKGTPAGYFVKYRNSKGGVSLKNKILKSIIQGIAVCAVLFSYLAPGITALASGIDQSFTTTADANGYGMVYSGSEVIDVWQTFTPSETSPIYQVDVWSHKNSTLTSGNIYMVIETTSAGLPTGTILATSANVAVSSYLTTDSFVPFTFASPVTANASTVYAWVLMGAASFSNTAPSGIRAPYNSGGGYSGGQGGVYGSTTHSYTVGGYGQDYYFQEWGNYITGGTVSSASASVASYTSENLTGSIDALTGSSNMTSWGFNAGTTPSFGTNITNSGSMGTGSFTNAWTGLTANTTYFWRAYAYTATDGYHYGGTQSFIFNPGAPSVVTLNAVYADATTATAYGAVLALGASGANYTQLQIQWGVTSGNYTNNVTSSGSWSGVGILTGGGFSENITGVTDNVTYFIRAGAYDGVAWGYGAETTYTHHLSTAGYPVVYTAYGTTDSPTTAQLWGILADSGSSNVSSLMIRYGLSSGNYTTTLATSVNMSQHGSPYYSFNMTASGLIAGTTYHFQAGATNSQGTTWESDQTFKQTVPPSVVLVGASSAPGPGGNIAIFTAEVISLGSGGNLTARGFDVGTANGTWDISGGYYGSGLTEAGFHAGGVNEGLSGLGVYSLSAGGFTDNATYYYRAKAFNADNLSGQSGYSAVASFVYHSGVYSYALVRTDAARPMPDPTIKNKVNFGVTLITAPVPIIEYGTSYWYGSTNKTVNKFGSWSIYTFDDLGGMNSQALPNNTTIHYQAYAKDQNGHYSYGAVRDYTTNSLQSQIFVITSGAQIIGGTSAYFGGTATNNGLLTISQIGFTWGTDAGATNAGSWFTVPDQNNNAGAWHYTASGLSLNTHYYVKAVVIVGTDNVDGGVTDFITPSASSNATANAPQVRTDPPTGITTTGFIAHGTILDVGGANVVGMWFDVSTTPNYYQQRLYLPAGNFTAGPYQYFLSGWAPGTRIYYAYGATNAYGTDIGEQQSAILAGPGGKPGTPAPGSGGVSIDGFVNMMAFFMGRMGMDTPMGHWGFMFLLILLVAIAGVIFIVTQKEPIVKKIYAVITAALIICIAAAFIFSGLLGILTIVVVIIAAIAAIVLFAVGKYRGTN